MLVSTMSMKLRTNKPWGMLGSGTMKPDMKTITG